MLIRTIFTFITIGILFVFVSCEKDAQIENNIHTEGVRLKHLTTGAEVDNLLRPLMQDHTLVGENFVDVGSYPLPVYRYYYDITWDWDLKEEWQTIYRTLSCSTGRGVESIEEMLQNHDDYVVIQDERLGKAPYNNVFAIREDHEISGWRFEIYILKVGNNMRNQSITFSGSHGPVPPDNEQVITELLKLLEPID